MTTVRPVHLLVLLLVQGTLVAVACWAPLSARLTGTEVRLAVAPLDPIDPFRGAYLTLDYPGLPRQDPMGQRPTGTVYVPLRRAGDVWVGERESTTRPEGGPYLTCRRTWQLRCGIESWFVPQDEAARLGRELGAGKLTAVVRVDVRGNAALVGLEEATG